MRRSLSLVVVAALAAAPVFAAKKKPPPPPEAPPVEQPATSPPAPPPLAPIAPPAAGLGLDETLRRALAKHPALRAADERVSARRAQAIGPWAPFVPMIVLSAGVDHRVDPLAGPFYSYLYPNATINSQVFRGGVGVKGLAPTGTEYELSLDHSLGFYSSIVEALNPRIQPGLRLKIAQNVVRGFWPSTQLAPLDAADARIELEEALAREQRDTILVDIATAWLAAAEAASVLALRQRSVELATQFEALTRQLIEGGEQSQLDLALALQTVAQRQVEHARAQVVFDDAALVLANVGWLEQKDVGIPTLDAPVTTTPTFDEILAQVRAYSPQLQQLSAKKRAAEAARVVAVDKGLPTVKVGVEGSVSGLSGQSTCANGYLIDGLTPCALPPEYSGGYDQAWKNLAGARFYAVGISLTGDLPTWPGPQAAEGEAAAHELLALAHEEEAREHDVAWAARRALADVAHGAELYEASNRAVELAEKALAAEETKLKAGRSTGVDLVRAQEILIGAELQRAEASARVVRAQMVLRAITGKLAP